MNDNKNAVYIQEMIRNFKIPQEDALSECVLAASDTSQPEWDSGVFISTKQSNKYYSDIYQFWVRAFFCFIEDIQKGYLFNQVISSVICNKISAEDFGLEYHKLLQRSIKSQFFNERQNYPDTYVEIEKRKFTNSYAILSRLDIRSSVAHSDGEFVAYFISGKSLQLFS